MADAEGERMKTDSEIKVSIPTSTTGFSSRECPECVRRFMVRPTPSPDAPVRYCPYCRHEGQNCWFTKDQAEYLKGYAASTVVMPMVHEMLKNALRGGKGFTLRTPHSPSIPEPPKESEEGMILRKLNCCERDLMVMDQPADEVPGCPYCP